jgi:phosphoribosylpyrophosphate synthetase
LFIPNAQNIRGRHVAFLASFSSPGVIFEQLSIIYNLPKLFIASFTLILPFFPTGTSERMEDEGDVATAFTLARSLSHIPISRGGPTSLVIFDIHALQVTEIRPYHPVDFFTYSCKETIMSKLVCNNTLGEILLWRCDLAMF